MPRPQTTPPTKPKRSSEHAPAQAAVADDAPPMKQHRGLFYLLLTIFIVWIAALVVMYCTTVRTHGGRLAPMPPPTTAQAG